MASEKEQLRAQLKDKRDAMGELQRFVLDSRILKHVCETPEWKQAEYVCIYASFGSEIDTWDIMAHAWSSYKRVLLPRVVEGTRKLEWYSVRVTDTLSGNVWGIAEPIPTPETKVDVAQTCKTASVLAIVPALAYDARGFRIGYGGGFYDEFLAGFEGMSMGLVRSEFFFDELPGIEPHDVAVDLVISERGIEKANQA